jgi:cold shock CspA family protein
MEFGRALRHKARLTEKRMARVAKPKQVASITLTREGSSYRLRLEDEAGKAAVYEATSDQALRLADALDDALADEEEEQRPRLPAPKKGPSNALDGSGTVKWYNPVKGFGFITPAGGGDDLFVHRSALEQAGITELAEGTRVRIKVTEGKKGPTVSALARE